MVPLEKMYFAYILHEIDRFFYNYVQKNINLIFVMRELKTLDNFFFVVTIFSQILSQWNILNVD